MIEDEQKETKAKKRTFQKSRPYPPLGIEEALRFSATVEKLGARNVSVPILLKEFGVTNPTTTSFWRKVASAKYFGLIVVDGKAYTVTDRARLILRPKDEDSKKNLLRELFLSPDLYKDLYDKFKEKQIPSEDTLANVLLHDHGISVNASKDAARAFIDSAKFIGLLGSDNVLIDSSEKSEVASGVQCKDVATLKQTPLQHISTTITVPIKLSKGMASIILPEGGITKRDNERLQKLIDIYVIDEESANE